MPFIEPLPHYAPLIECEWEECENATECTIFTHKMEVIGEYCWDHGMEMSRRLVERELQDGHKT